MEKKSFDPRCLQSLSDDIQTNLRHPGVAKPLDGLDSNSMNTLEYGFYYVNGVLAAAQRISQENSEGDTEQVPADFYFIVDEARERLDKIRGILGFFGTDDSGENLEG